MNRLHTLSTALLLATAAAASTALLADDEHRYTAVNDPLLQAECGSCHIVYPPRLLPARSWRALMSGLDKHFGTDASLDAATAARVTALLERHAGRDRNGSAAPALRLTETRWFVHEHDEVPARTWKHPQVKSAANCAACHTNADRGRYGEHDIRLPR